jgi:hypothetical protein
MIALVGLPNTKNLGDQVLLQNTEVLIRSIAPNQKIESVDLEFVNAPMIPRNIYLGAETLPYKILSEVSQRCRGCYLCRWSDFYIQIS